MRGEGSLAPDAESKLAKQGRVITRLAREGELDSVVGREDEIKRMLQILARYTKNNSALIGVDKLIGSPLSRERIDRRMERGGTFLVDVNPDGHVVFEPVT